MPRATPRPSLSAARRGRVAAILAALVAASAVLPSFSTLMAPNFAPRLALFYTSAAALVAHTLWASARSGRATLRVDTLDLVVLAFAVWIVVTTVVAPAPDLAWLGSYNRGTGALFWLVGLAVFAASRRALADEGALDVFAVGLACVMIVESLTVAAQAAGLETPWDTSFMEQGRMSGTLGNPVLLAGASLCSVWLGGRALLTSEFRGARAWVVAVGAAAGALMLVSAVSRAGYLGWAAAALMLVLVLARRRAWRRVGALLAVAVLLGLLTVAYSPESQSAAASGVLASRVTDQVALSESDQGRVEFWEAGLSALVERPLFGYGAGAYATAYRFHVSAERLRSLPSTVVSDPHDLPVLIGSTMGVPGLALAFVLFALAATAWWRSGRASRDPDIAYWAGPAFAAAVGAFLLFSPLDLAVAVPAVLIVGASVSGPNGRVLPWGVKKEGRAVQRVLLGCALATVVIAVVLGWQTAALWRADAKLLDYDRSGDTAMAREAADLAPRWPYYSLLAGFGTWREGLANQDKSLVNEGEKYLRESLSSDPFLVQARLELSRLYLATTREDQAAGELRAALDVNRHHPIAQGLLGYLAYVAASGDGGGIPAGASGSTFAQALLAELEKVPVDSADGWYWIARTREVLGDVEGAGLADQKASAIDPSLSAAQYKDRVSGG